MSRSVSVSSWLLMLCLVASAAPAELIALRADRMLDVESGRILSNATVLVDGERIQKVYTEEPARRPAGARRVDLGGATVVPGLVDAHLHLAGIGAQGRRVDLRGTHSAAEALARVKEFLELNPDAEPVIGFGWDQNDWQVKGFPGKGDLDAASA